MEQMEAAQLAVPPLRLGECPVWIARTQTLYYVDIQGCALYAYPEQTATVRRVLTPGAACFVAPWGEQLLLGVRDTLYRVHPQAETLTCVMRLDIAPQLRMNDGKCDPQGTLWVGVMAADRALPNTAKAGKLLGIREGRILQTLGPMDIPNGMAWQGKLFYHTDSSMHRIDVYTRSAHGFIGERRTAVEIVDGIPDGFCIDREGMLWVALWGAGCVQRFDPNTGKALAQRIRLPQRNASSCCFGGEDLRTLYITTAEGPGGLGGLYACRTKVSGLLPDPYGG